MGKKDNAQKTFYDDNERFADLYNGIIFHGEQIIKPEELSEADPNIVYYTQREYQSLIPDKVKKWNGTHLAILTLENQSLVDYSMVFRAMKTESVSYDKQLRKRKRYNKKYKTYDNNAEFICGIKKNDKFIPIIIIVLYLGRDAKWDGATSLYDMLYMDKRLEPYITNYRLNLYDYHDHDDFSMFKTENRELFELLSCSGDEKKMDTLIHANANRYHEIDADAANVINLVAGIDITLNKNINTDGQEVVNMCKAWDDHWNEGKIEGKIESSVETIFMLLERFGKLPQKLQSIIENEKNHDILKTWIMYAAQCTSVEEFMQRI